MQVEESHLKNELHRLPLNLQHLRKCTERFLTVILDKEYQLSEVDCTRREVRLCEPFIEKHSNLYRAFLVVMDYDPQSLCITGQPDLELSVQSG
jgi:hypothetical protein